MNAWQGLLPLATTLHLTPHPTSGATDLQAVARLPLFPTDGGGITQNPLSEVTPAIPLPPFHLSLTEATPPLPCLNDSHVSQSSGSHFSGVEPAVVAMVIFQGGGWRGPDSSCNLALIAHLFRAISPW